MWRGGAALARMVAMNRSERHALLATAILPIIMAAVWFQAPLWCGVVLFITCPILVVHLVWRVLHDTTTPTSDLPQGHEWDYADRTDLRERR